LLGGKIESRSRLKSLEARLIDAAAGKLPSKSKAAA